ncbi:DUF6448 family protein [Tissierella sp.]|uniref:DUF6448 family protein n=1 Tax=Tissierella sp. TaxID=41274 RepID=UPI002860EDB3|nr:DUF6448 family protein [Tissierella sp.]MDR7855243.1 DUF6448 family protein [Tissierella sp.]
MKKSRIFKSVMGLMTAIAIMIMLPISASAHCDTMDGPTVIDGLEAMEENNINHALIWVMPDYEAEITEVFELSMKVKDLSPDAKALAEQYFLSELIRVHRAGEGAPFTGVKPSGTTVDKVVIAADESIAIGDLSPMEGLIEEERMQELEERFDNAMALKDFDVNDVEAGREYIEAYVKFFKFAEGEEDHHGEVGGHEEAGHSEEETATHEEEAVETHSKEVASENNKNWLPWSLAGLFLITTIISHVKLDKAKKK